MLISTAATAVGQIGQTVAEHRGEIDRQSKADHNPDSQQDPLEVRPDLRDPAGQTGLDGVFRLDGRGFGGGQGGFDEFVRFAVFREES